MGSIRNRDRGQRRARTVRVGLVGAGLGVTLAVAGVAHATSAPGSGSNTAGTTGTGTDGGTGSGTDGSGNGVTPDDGNVAPAPGFVAPGGSSGGSSGGAHGNSNGS